MRTTLTIDDDVFAAAKEMAHARNKSIGEVVSELVRTALTAAPHERAHRNGILLLPVQPGSRPVTSELVKELAEQLL